MSFSAPSSLDKEPQPLPLHHTPIVSSFAIFFADPSQKDNYEGGKRTRSKLIADATAQEEDCADGSVTAAFTSHGEMCLLDFSGSQLAIDELMQFLEDAKSLCASAGCKIDEVMKSAEDRAAKEKERGQKVREMKAKADGEVGKQSGNDFIALGGQNSELNREEEEEEKYRKMALDYTIGHVAAEIKPKAAEKKKKKEKGIPNGLKVTEETANVTAKDGSAGKRRATATLDDTNDECDDEEEAVVMIGSEFTRQDKGGPEKEKGEGNNGDVGRKVGEGDDEEESGCDEGRIKEHGKNRTMKGGDAVHASSVEIPPEESEDDDNDDLDLTMAVKKAKSKVRGAKAKVKGSKDQVNDKDKKKKKRKKK